MRGWIKVDGAATADVAHCRYVDDSGTGITRRRQGKGWSYRDAHGHLVTDAATLGRIKKLVIPPAWTAVWICPSPDGHIQATGRDARGRKQYRYHERFRQSREETKYERMISFAETLPVIRRHVDEHMGLAGLQRDKILATVVRLLELTLIRVGNESYARENGSFGLTTMRTRHVDVTGSQIRFHFRGKSKVTHVIDVHDRRLARVVQRCHELPGEELFQYMDDEGNLHSVESVHVNTYLREISGQDFTAKDFRTWAGTVLAAQALVMCEPPSSQTAAKRALTEAIRGVASRLGNTLAVCRKCYVHPAIIESFHDGQLHEKLHAHRPANDTHDPSELYVEESAVLALLRARLKGPVRAAPPRERRARKSA